MSNTPLVVVFVDGGSRGNPGLSGYGFVVFTITNSLNQDFSNPDWLLNADYTPTYEGHKFIGVATNNQAEWQGLLGALTWIKENITNQFQLVIYMDSELVVKQVLGVYKIKNQDLAKISVLVKNILKEFNNYKIIHIRRELNTLADKQANLAMDSQQ